MPRLLPGPTQRNSRDENEAVKAGQIPQEWYNKPAKLRQKDRDARWTKRHSSSFSNRTQRSSAGSKDGHWMQSSFCWTANENRLRIDLCRLP
jgi:hypothetical protein